MALGRDIYFEHVALGDSAKCAAIDPLSGVEVTIMGPVSANPRDLERLALAKLQKRLRELDQQAAPPA